MKLKAIILFPLILFVVLTGIPNHKKGGYHTIHAGLKLITKKRG